MSSEGGPPPEILRPLDPAVVEELWFWQAHRAARPLATRAIAGALGAVFALGLLWARGGPVPLGSMGWMDPDLVSPEPWRLLTCTFLHANFVHLLFNGSALFAIGNFLERAIGTARLLLVYTVAGLCGSLASAAFGDGPSVGASGAIFGLMGAELALFLRPSPFLPESVRHRARGAIWRPLLINGAISFLPGIDKWAHFGGALAGAALVASGLLTPRREAGVPPTVAGPVTRAAAAFCALLLVGALAWGWLETRPWQPPDPMQILLSN